MAESGITASFQFNSYKVDKVSFFTKPALDVLAQMNSLSSENMFFAFLIRTPIFFKTNKFYVGGFDVVMKVLRDTATIESETEEDILIKLDLGIAGIFKVVDDRLLQEQETQLVKINIPALLMPYARSAITSLLANAGFGSVLLPLINIHELAKEQMKDVEIKIID
jgi:preprotein translocase subunit SecB